MKAWKKLYDDGLFGKDFALQKKDLPHCRIDMLVYWDAWDYPENLSLHPSILVDISMWPSRLNMRNLWSTGCVNSRPATFSERTWTGDGSMNISTGLTIPYLKALYGTTSV